MYKIVKNLIVVCLIVHQISSPLVCNAKREVSRQKRSFFKFTRNSAMGLIAAIAVPLDLPKRNVFMSYNFELNYNLASTAAAIVPGILTRLELVRSLDANGDPIEGNIVGNSSGIQHYSQGEKLLSRRKMYKMLEHKLTSYGYNGTQCLLRTICESGETPLGVHNGLLGDLFHIVFTPSSSKKENLDKSYYDAEAEGGTIGCKGYKEHCPKNIFDYITKMI